MFSPQRPPSHAFGDLRQADEEAIKIKRALSLFKNAINAFD
jgi:hypothetical protein